MTGQTAQAAQRPQAGDDVKERSVAASDERRLDVLRAIVEDYVHTREPVAGGASA